ncbi:LysR family transcriptional regulator [Sphingomicrobium astaxanthinifaciens]|uniref:LysR family transcriptional regulator n=1 Tax=Sphingomicrobium astaxanthinifaciens TaxID=1227949 RepID=UPI001FCB113F|nr:LysR family transcriptional regulator [Sphingomicrobium astaxanthinifaciens]MCJ7421969.1 LysR family transcriptional regulator [Sphingomicrobium astaxanthinifaciens]
MFDWDDLRYFVGVADAGSTLKAAARLGANQTTVARRIAALERALGHQLFERGRAGYRLTEVGQRLLAHARPVAAAASAFAAEAAAARRALSGTVRLTVNEIYSEMMLTPLLAGFKAAHPQVRLELDHAHETRDLGRGEADIALRVATRIEGDALIARRIGEDRWTFYCSAAYAAANGKPRDIDALADHPLVGGGGPGVWDIYGRWLAHHAPGLEPVTLYDSSTGLLAAVRAGLGLAALPCLAVADDPALEPCFASGPVRRALWIVTHERTRQSPHIGAAMTYFGDALVRRAARLGLR